MAKKQRGQNNKFWDLYYYLKSIKHPCLRKKAMPSHSELLAAAKPLFGIDTRGLSKWEAIDLIHPCVPDTGANARLAARKAKLQARKAKEERPKPKPVTRQIQTKPEPALPSESIQFITSDAFLDSYDWKRLRYQVLKKHDGLCEVCGRGRPHGVILNVDHIHSRRNRPDLALEATNLQVLCGDCNHGKGNWDSTDWRNRKPVQTAEEREWEREAWERFE